MSPNRKLPADAGAGQAATLDGLVEEFRGRALAGAILAVDASGSVVTRSYANIAGDISRLAAGLVSRGLGDGAMILLWAPNSPEWVIAYLAITASGNIVVPLDDQISAAGLKAVLSHSRPAQILTVAAHLQELEACDKNASAKCILLDEVATDLPGWRQVCADETADTGIAPDPDRVASLLYTSGTTGTPKAVPLTHGKLMSNINALIAANLITASDRVLVPLPLHHAYPATVGMLTTLARGAALILPSGISGAELTAAARLGGATVLLGVPRLYATLIESVEAAVQARGHVARLLYRALMRASIALRRSLGIRAGRLLFRRVHERIGADLRIMASGGARLEAALAWKLEGLGWEVLTGYGLTETSPVVTFNTPDCKRLDSQGVPLAGVEIDIETIPDQPHGEVLVKGPNVFSGYWKNDAATQAAFTADGWFRTGDLGFLDADGFLHIVGRSKEIIVLPDGENVSPEEVEQVFEASPFIREAAVLEKDGSLVALIVPDDEAVRRRGAMREEALLRDEVEKTMLTLPSHQRVAEYRLIRRSLPRTRLGKLRRHLLPDVLELSVRPEAAPPQAELTVEDRRLLESKTVGAAWQWLEERFAAKGVSLDSSPQLDLGIDSLGWVTITSEVEQNFGISLIARDLSQVVTVRDLLQAIDTASRQPSSSPGAASVAAQQYLQDAGPGLRLLRRLLLALNRVLMRGLFRLRVKGLSRLPQEGPFVITPNHASYLDPSAVAAALPRDLLANVCWAGWAGKTHKGPVFRTVSRATSIFPVDPDQDLGGGIRLGAQALEKGRILVWFPEGRRSPDGTIRPFLRGIGALIESTRVPAVPVRIYGSFEAWPSTRAWPRLRPVTVVFGTPQTADTLLSEGQGHDAPARICDALERCIRATVD